MRRLLFERMPAHAFERVNMTAVARSVTRLATAGWTVEDIASQVLGDYGNGDPAALVVTRLGQLDGPPPRDSTPQPPAMGTLQAQRAREVAESANVNHHEWASYIKAQVREQRARGA